MATFNRTVRQVTKMSQQKKNKIYNNGKTFFLIQSLLLLYHMIFPFQQRCEVFAAVIHLYQNTIELVSSELQENIWWL